VKELVWQNVKNVVKMGIRRGGGVSVPGALILLAFFVEMDRIHPDIGVRQDLSRR